MLNDPVSRFEEGSTAVEEPCHTVRHTPKKKQNHSYI